MKIILPFLFFIFSSFPVAQATSAPSNRPPLFEGTGRHHYAVTVKNPLAQKYFDQGLILSYGFNHPEAERSFLEAQRLDPQCAMCFWGAALVLGPNINMNMDPANNPRALSYLQKASAVMGQVTQKERDMISALKTRYSADETVVRSQLDANYTEAMKTLHTKYPFDPDIATLYAEASMDQHPWDFWLKTGEAQPWVPQILAALESAIKLDPLHPGAHHFYIHAIEASQTPARALPSADILASLVPGAGHIVHMPSHIFIRVGQYHRASQANEDAIVVDQKYIDQVHQAGLYTTLYRPHNFHFLVAAASIEGRSQLALSTANKLAAMLESAEFHTHAVGHDTTMMQQFYLAPLLTQVRFAHWDEILQQKKPAENFHYAQAIWHYARAIALTRKKDFPKAMSEIKLIEQALHQPELENLMIANINKATVIVGIAYNVARGEWEAEQGNDHKHLSRAIAYLEEAKNLEDSLRYIEPDDWHQPVREVLGYFYLKDKNYSQAEKVYLEDLHKFPKNGWSLFGLAETYRSWSKIPQAKLYEKKFQEAWKYADIKINHSRL